MIFAARKLQGIGLIALVTLFFLLAYPIHLSVSSTRGELRAVEQRIAEARARNRMIEGDIAVLANVRQLDRWNVDYFGYVAPTAEQYLPGERALAALDSLRAPAGGAARTPVLVAMAPAIPAPTRQSDDDGAGTAARTDQVRQATLARVSVARIAMRDFARPARRGAPASADADRTDGE